MTWILSGKKISKMNHQVQFIKNVKLYCNVLYTKNKWVRELYWLSVLHMLAHWSGWGNLGFFNVKISSPYVIQSILIFNLTFQPSFLGGQYGTLKNFSVSTMLQKLSKCEVKPWLCRNLIILPPLRFYLKSNFGVFKRSKNVIFGNFRGSELWILVNFGLEICSNWLK